MATYFKRRGGTRWHILKAVIPVQQRLIAACGTEDYQNVAQQADVKTREAVCKNCQKMWEVKAR